jgi:hypothetical protein
MLKDERPGHPYLKQSGPDFLAGLRAWRSDRCLGHPLQARFHKRPSN